MLHCGFDSNMEREIFLSEVDGYIRGSYRRRLGLQRGRPA